MAQILFQLALAVTAGVIYLLTGRNRRQVEKVPEGMVLLCQPPQKRYVVYALGVVVLAFCYPLRRSREVYWREVQSIEVVREKKGGQKSVLTQKMRFLKNEMASFYGNIW